MFESGGNPIRFLKTFSNMIDSLIRQFVGETLRASENADLIILTAGGGFGLHAAQKLGIPYCQAFIQPFTPTTEFENPIFPEYPSWIPFGRSTYNYQSYFLFQRLIWQFVGRTTNNIRKEMGLDLLSVKGSIRRMICPEMDVLYGYSPSFIPTPRDWGPTFHVTGYWFLDSGQDYSPPAELVDFIESGPPPVFIGFGSMMNREPGKVTMMVVEALKKTRQRGIILIGNDGMDGVELPDYVLGVGSVPFDWLFPRVSAVVHHGGTGTTGAGLRFGKPTIVVPYFADQPFWGRRVYKAGVGCKPIPQKRLTSKKLEDAIKTVTSDEEIKKRAAILGEEIRREDGIREAVRVINQFQK